MEGVEHNAAKGVGGADGAALRARNRLGRERSPYLRQHAHNPVAWFAWGEEAFEQARRRGAPVFLSIGYATCYWCHVMERESFEDARIGAIMSERFVCVKVDREERPDVDDIYMAAVQMLTGRGGWPMSVFLTPPGARGHDDPGLEPFWGGTYFPPSPRHGLPSFEQLLEGMSDAWTNQREQALKQAGAITDAVRERLEARAAPVRLGATHIGRAVQELLGIYDDANGGFGTAPKFPQPVFVDLLLDAGPHMSDESHRRAAATAVRRTLDAMALGGVFDQVGGGFHRYSVDGHWTVPHFEKMLYDNAQLALTYARAYEAFGDEHHARIARRTLDYVLHEMTAEGGAFYSAQDAEVNGREGLNYLWTPEETRACLGAEDAAYAASLYGLDGAPNFRDPHHPDEPARHVLRLRERPAPDEWGRIDRVNAALLAARARREQPRLDDKVIASWNGLMIGALADAGQALGEPKYVDAAQRAAAFLWSNLRDASGAMLRIWRDGSATTPAILEDYAMLAHGLVRLHDALMALGRAPEGTECFARAITLMREARGLFSVADTGAWFDTRAGAKDLLVRARSTHDGALPSAASMALHTLMDLHERTNERAFLDDAGRLLAGMSAAVDESPLLCANTARALLRMLRTDPGVIERSGMTRESAERALDQGANAERAGVDADETPVEVYADAERVSVGESAPGELRLLLRIGEGWHITAHEPFGAGVADEERIEGLEGLRVFVGGGAGVRAAVEYPDGEPLRLRVDDADAPGEDGADALPALRVHTGEVELRVRLERDGAPWAGRPMLYVRYQPCTEMECREAVTVELDVAIDLG